MKYWLSTDRGVAQDPRRAAAKIGEEYDGLTREELAAANSPLLARLQQTRAVSIVPTASDILTGTVTPFAIVKDVPYFRCPDGSVCRMVTVDGTDRYVRVPDEHQPLAVRYNHFGSDACHSEKQPQRLRLIA